MVLARGHLLGKVAIVLRGIPVRIHRVLRFIRVRVYLAYDTTAQVDLPALQILLTFAPTDPECSKLTGGYYCGAITLMQFCKITLSNIDCV